jgi:diamine N-acetyltransferase
MVKINENMLTGSKIRLRALEPGDIDLLYAWENDMDVWKVSNTLSPFSRFQIEEYVLSAHNDVFTTRQLRLMIDLLGQSLGEKSVGTIEMFDFNPLHHRAGVGILIREPFRDKGYGFDALNVFVRYAFSTLRLHQLYCNISPDNAPSLTLFQKLGFVRCGVKKDWVHDGQGWQEEWMYQLIRDDA